MRLVLGPILIVVHWFSFCWLCRLCHSGSSARTILLAPAVCIIRSSLGILHFQGLYFIEGFDEHAQISIPDCLDARLLELVQLLYLDISLFFDLLYLLKGQAPQIHAQKIVIVSLLRIAVVV